MDTNTRWDDGAIVPKQAKDIANILYDAYKNNTDIVVHCNMGECRSGAVVEVATWMGYDDPLHTHGISRVPNSVVMNMIANELYDLGEI
jgi:predicted protein tyrosine phosphatase